MMRLPSYSIGLLAGLFAAIGGVLGNLVAAVIEHTVGQFTLVQFAGMTLGIVVIIAGTLLLEQWRAQQIRNEELLKEIGSHRKALYELVRKFRKGIAGQSDLYSWYFHQSEIAKRRDELKGKITSYDPIDYESPPTQVSRARKGCVEIILRIGKPLLFIIVVPIIFALSYGLSPVAQYGYLNYIATPTPTPTLTPTPTVTPTSTLAPTITPTSTSTPTNTPVAPTSTVTPTSISTPTNTPVQPTPTAAPTSTLGRIDTLVEPTPTVLRGKGTPTRPAKPDKSTPTG